MIRRSGERAQLFSHALTESRPTGDAERHVRPDTETHRREFIPLQAEPEQLVGSDEERGGVGGCPTEPGPGGYLLSERCLDREV